MKFPHCADIHLDGPLLGLEASAGDLAPEFRRATRRAFENIIKLAEVEKADFVLVAGDIRDIALKGFEAPLFFGKQMGRPAEAGIPLAFIFGNHDAKHRRGFDLRPPPNIHVLAADHPESVEISDGVWMRGQSFARQAETANLVAGYPAPVPDTVNIRLPRTSLAARGAAAAAA